MIVQNIIEKKVWCTQPECPCFQYNLGEISRVELDEKGDSCYESHLLDKWTAYAGIFHNGPKAGEGIKMKKVQKNSLCVLTTREPNTSEEDRYIFGLFLVDDSYTGDSNNSGSVSTSSKFKLEFTPDEAKQLIYWRYNFNSNSPDKAHWGTGLFRYLSDEQSAQILRDAKAIKTGTIDEKLATEFYDYYCNVNVIDINRLGAPEGVLIERI
jgi:hypothetical protein